MYGKIFRQIFDSSIAEDWQVRCVFQDMVVLANEDGVVDMTVQAIARTTNVPLQIVQRGICELEKVDPQSRSGLDDGARIKRLDDHRDWGWRIVNYNKYRLIATEFERRELNRQRMADYRNRKEKRVLLSSCSTTGAHTAYASASVLPKGVQGGNMSDAERVTLDKALSRGIDRLAQLRKSGPHPQGSPELAEINQLKPAIADLKSRLGVPI